MSTKSFQNAVVTNLFISYFFPCICQLSCLCSNWTLVHRVKRLRSMRLSGTCRTRVSPSTMVEITIRKRPRAEAVVTQRKFFKKTARGKVIKGTHTIRGYRSFSHTNPQCFGSDTCGMMSAVVFLAAKPVHNLRRPSYLPEDRQRVSCLRTVTMLSPIPTFSWPKYTISPLRSAVSCSTKIIRA